MAKDLELVEKTNSALKELEDEEIKRLSKALDASYSQLEDELLRRYSRYTADSKPDLLPNQRALLLVDQLKTVIGLVSPEMANSIQRRFTKLLKTASEEGITLSNELMNLRSGGSFVAENTVVPIAAIRFAASDAVKRLSKHSDKFREDATTVITQGLIQGWGAQRTATQLRRQLGVTKGRAEMIARTETVSALSQATQQNYKANGIEYVQWLATSGDNRTCPFCVGRNGNVYELGKVAIPAHPNCRCYPLCWDPRWAELGLIDEAQIQQQRQDGLGALKEAGKEPDNGPSPFEKLNGSNAKPKPVATPDDEASLLKSLMIEGRRQIATLGDSPSIADFENFRNKLLKSGLSDTEASELANQSSLTDEAVAAAAGYGGELHYELTLTEWHMLTSGRVKNFEGFIYDTSRAQANVEGDELGYRTISVGNTPNEGTLFHELGHFLEADYPNLGKMAKLWRSIKASGEPEKLSKLTGIAGYADKEVAYPGSFYDPYVGKVYGDSNYTEVISMGLEKFGSHFLMEDLFYGDRDHFALMVAVIAAAQGRIEAGSAIFGE